MICTVCLLDKPTTEFYIRKSGKRKGSYYNSCKLCIKLDRRGYYHKNKHRQGLLSSIRKKKYLSYLRGILIDFKSVPCADCGVTYPHYVMDFDHLDPTKKLYNVSSMVGKGKSKNDVLNEISKCGVVCANCHRKRTWERNKYISSYLSDTLYLERKVNNVI